MQYDGSMHYATTRPAPSALFTRRLLCEWDRGCRQVAVFSKQKTIYVFTQTFML